MRTAAAVLVFALASLVRMSAGEIPGARIPVVQERRYVMSGAVRPLLFWIKRDDIGLARIVWRRGADGSRGYEFLVGTDPSRAPGSINRWGFISEEARGDDGALLALMTGSQQTSFDNEAAAASRPGGEFQAAITRVEGGVAEWRLSRINTADRMTVHDVRAVVGSVPRHGNAQRRAVTPGTRPGFLIAVADMLDIAQQASAAAAVPKDRVRYVFGDQVYEMHLRNVERASVRYMGGEVQALKTSFETRTLATGAKTQFVVTAGTSGDLAGVPIEIEWQPRWWLRVRLQLAAAD